MGRAKKVKSANIEISRPQAVLTSVRSLSVHRQLNGRLGSSLRHHDRSVTTPVVVTGTPAQSSDSQTSWQPLDHSYMQVVDDSMGDQDLAHTDVGDQLDVGEQPESVNPPRGRPLDEWLPHRQAYLDEMIRSDGRDGCPLVCSECSDLGHYKCRDCAFGKYYCKTCIIKDHRFLPLHRLLYWTGSFHEDISLKDLGFVIQLGHSGSRCPCPSKCTDDFVVLDVSGLHTVKLRFCECPLVDGGVHVRFQLLRFGWFPSTVSRPRSAFTFEVLNTFHLFTLQGKTSAYDFYMAMAHKSDNTGLLPIKDRYRQFLTVIRIWRHLKSLKRAGRGHDPAGVDATAPGQCAIECPACPHPGRNLPLDWETASADTRWLYVQILTIDANFRLSNKSRGIKNDPPLGDGWGHWVPEGPYQEYISKYGHQAEVNLCDSDLHAIDHAHSKFSKGYTATGVGGVVCGRHTLVRKNGLGSLQKGERYANMDFIVFFTLLNTLLSILVFSYDIACQWSRNLRKRMGQLPATMQISEARLADARFVIPKFHIYAHSLSCQSIFSLNFLRFSAETNGEDPERWWAHINPVSMSTKEMGPGSRVDTIDDHAGAWNWRKITGFGTSLATQLSKAVRMQMKHRTLHLEFSAAFPEEVIKQWTSMVEAWNTDHRRPNPYAESMTTTSMASLRLELAKEEAADAADGDLCPHDTSPSAFLQLGLDLEDQQRALRQAKKGKTTHQDAEFHEKQNILRGRILSWLEVRRIYMPNVEVVPERGMLIVSPELIPLRLPSSMQMASRHTSCLFDLPEKERRLRLAQAEDALSDLRKQLRVTMGLWRYKTTQIGHSQKTSTRSRTLISRFAEKTTRCAERYRAARSALLALDPNGDWRARLQALKDEDIKCPGKGDNEAEGTREISWIWRVEYRTDPSSNPPKDLMSISDGDFADSLRREWAKSSARAERWSEEVMLLSEEMRRVVAFLHWKAHWWNSQGRARTHIPDSLADGLRSYAAKQAQIHKNLAVSFASRWHLILKANNIQVPVEWAQSLVGFPTSMSTTTLGDDGDEKGDNEEDWEDIYEW